MPENCGFSLDDQAKWELIMEMDRYHRKLRHLETVRHESTDDMARHACLEHLERVTDIYAQAGTRQKPSMQSPPWMREQLLRQ